MFIQEIRRKLEKGEALLVDVREPDEWAQGYIQEAILLSLSQIMRKNFASLPEEKTLYLYCRSGGRVIKAFEILKTNYPNVVPLQLGYMDFVDAGFPITR